MKTAMQLIEEAREDLNRASKRLKYAEERLPAPTLQTEDEMWDQWAREVLLSLAGQPTTESPTTDSPSDAPERAFTPPLRPASRPSDPAATPSGPAEQPSWCAHSRWRFKATPLEPWIGSEMMLTCLDCGASSLFVRTPVPDAPATSSTSPSGAASSSAASPAEAPAESPSPESSELRGVPQVYQMEYIDFDHVRLTPVAW